MDGHRLGGPAVRVRAHLHFLSFFLLPFSHRIRSAANPVLKKPVAQDVFSTIVNYTFCEPE